MLKCWRVGLSGFHHWSRFVRPFALPSGLARRSMSQRFPTKEFSFPLNNTRNETRNNDYFEDKNNRKNAPRKHFTFEEKTASALIKLKMAFEKHSSKTYLTNDDWAILKAEVLSENFINQAAFDSLLMKYFNQEKRYKLARSFLDFVRQKSKLTPNVMTLANYVALCGRCLSETTEDELISTLEEIHPDTLLHPDVATLVVDGLAQTSHWRRCFQIIQNLKPHKSMWSKVAAAAFGQSDYETAWNLLNELSECDTEPLESVFEKCVLSVRDHGSSLENTKAALTKMLHYCRNNRILISYKCATELQQLLQQTFSFDGKFVTIRSLQCPCCHELLEKTDLSADELKRLQDSVKSNVVIGSDVFRQSRPEEVTRFLQFIKNVSPYDVVVDSLNVCNANGKNAMQLLSVVNYFANKNKKVVVIGRQHMMQWPKAAMSSIRKKAACFFAENISKEDPFLLYSALISGADTYFVSNDIFRDHRFKLNDDEMRGLFDRWRLSRQILYSGVDRFGKAKFVHPVQQDICIQGGWEDGWHIPCRDDTRELGPYDYCTTWLCLANKKKLT